MGRLDASADFAVNVLAGWGPAFSDIRRAKLSSPVMIPGRLGIQRSWAHGAAASTVTLTVMTRSVPGRSELKVTVLPAVSCPDASRNSGFHCGQLARSARIAQTCWGRCAGLGWCADPGHACARRRERPLTAAMISRMTPTTIAMYPRM